MANEFLARNGLISQNNSTITGSLTVTGGITGSLQGTASYATTASYALTSSYSTNISGTTNYISKFTGTNSLGNSVMFESGSNIGIGGTPQIGFKLDIFGQTVARGDVYISGNLVEFGSSRFQFSGYGGTSWVSSGSGNFGVGTNTPAAKLDVRAPGALSTDIAFRIRNSANTFDIIRANGAGDVFVGQGAGSVSTGVQNTFIGFQAGYTNSTGISNSFLGFNAGYNNTTGTQNTFIGLNSGAGNTIGSNNIALGLDSGWFIADGVTANTIAYSSIYLGTSTKALANNQTNQIVIGDSATGLGNNSVVLGNNSITLTALKGKVGIGTTAPTHKLHVSGSTRITGEANTSISSSLTVYGSGSAQPVFTVQGSQGELFSITDSLSGSLFSVNDISGLPILEVFSDNTTLIGNYLDPMLITTAKVVQTNSGSFTLYSLPTASYDTAFFEYSVRSGSNARAGTIMAIQSGTAVNFTETTTTDFGSTSAISFTVIVSGSNIALTGSSTTGAWTIKTIIRSI
jgi:hypothetical protein